MPDDRKERYDKERRRINEQIKDLKSRGLEPPKLDIPKLDYPTEGDIEKLQNISNNELEQSSLPNKSAAIMDSVSNIAEDLFSHVEKPGGINALRRSRYKLDKGANRNVLNTHTLQYAENSKERINYAKDMINQTVKIYGREETSAILEQNAERLTDIINTIIYASSDDNNQISNAFMELTSILSGETLSLTESQEISDEAERL